MMFLYISQDYKMKTSLVITTINKLNKFKKLCKNM